MAKALRVGKTTANYVSKKALNKKVLKKAKVCRSTNANDKKRKEWCEAILARLDSGDVELERVVFSGETWLSAGQNYAYLQNDKKYFDRNVKKDDVAAELLRQAKQRAPGLMLHMAVSAVDGGVVIAPHFAQAQTTVDIKCYCDLLEWTTLPRARLAMDGRAWWRQQDGASPHTAKAAQKFLKDNLELMLADRWPATSACLNPLDYCVWSKLKDELFLSKKYDTARSADIQTNALRAIQKFADDADWKKQLRKACMSFRYRCEQIVKSDGKMTIPKRRKKQYA